MIVISCVFFAECLHHDQNCMFRVGRDVCQHMEKNVVYTHMGQL